MALLLHGLIRGPHVLLPKSLTDSLLILVGYSLFPTSRLNFSLQISLITVLDGYLLATAQWTDPDPLNSSISSLGINIFLKSSIELVLPYCTYMFKRCKKLKAFKFSLRTLNKSSSSNIHSRVLVVIGKLVETQLQLLTHPTISLIQLEKDLCFELAELSQVE